MTWVRALAIVASTLALVAAGCGGTTAPAPAPAPSSPAPTTAVSKACRQSFASYRHALIVNPSINEGRYQRRTIKSCTQDEWLSIASTPRYGNGDYCIACAEPTKVLDAFCGDPRSKAQACKEETEE